MQSRRELAAAFGVLIVAWILFGFTIGYFNEYGVIGSELYPLFITTLLALIFIPLIMMKARWTAIGAIIAGIINMIIAIDGIAGTPASGLYGPAVLLVLSVLFTYFSFRVYKEK